MTEVYNLQNLLNLSSKIKLTTKIELFKNRLDYEQALITEKVAIIHEGQLHLMINKLLIAIDTTKLSEKSIKDFKNIIAKNPGNQIDITNSKVIINVSELEKSFGSKSKKLLSVSTDNDYIRAMGLDLSIDLYSFNFSL
jgi:hypothetical protein